MQRWRNSWMQSPDVNVLVNAFRQDAEYHHQCRAWLDNALSGGEQVAFSELVLSGVLRILTHSKIFMPPTPTNAAIAFVDALLAQPMSITLRPGSGHWRIFRGLLSRMNLRGNKIPDAYHAALALEHGCEWVTLDRGFSAYPGLHSIFLLDRL